MRLQPGFLTKLLFVSVLAATPGSLRADEMPIFGNLSGLQCKGAADSAFPGFAISSFSFGDSTTASAGAASSGASTGKPTFQDISIVKKLDDCTPLLFGAVAHGGVIANATITVVSKGSKTPVLLIQLSDVVVTSDKFTEGAAQELDEVITLSYRKIIITHVPSGNNFAIDVATLGAA